MCPTQGLDIIGLLLRRSTTVTAAVNMLLHELDRGELFITSVCLFSSCQTVHDYDSIVLSTDEATRQQEDRNYYKVSGRLQISQIFKLYVLGNITFGDMK